MVYRIIGISSEDLPDHIEGVYEDPRLVKKDRDLLRQLFPSADLAILQNEMKIDDTALAKAIDSFEIQLIMEDECKLPLTYKRGWGTEDDDVASGNDGRPTRVKKPINPDDRFE
jgi:hypothetical protein